MNRGEKPIVFSVSLLRDEREPGAEQVHRRTNETRRHANANMHLPDGHRLSDVRRVPRSTEDSRQPRDHRTLEAHDLRLVCKNSVRVFVFANTVLKLDRKARKVWFCGGKKRTDDRFRSLVEPYVLS